MTQTYDSAYISQYYDEYSHEEWERLGPAASPSNQVSFHIHRRYLEKYICSGDHVLEAGAGPGRFTIELSRLGATVVVGDISAKQLELNQLYVERANCSAAVRQRVLLDIVDLSRFPTGHFDSVVCYGGALSYVFDRADDALSGLLRVTKPGGLVLLSVMSLLGSGRQTLADVLAFTKQYGLADMDRARQSGDIPLGSQKHVCRMYRFSSLQALLARHPCTLLAASASNFLSVGNEAVLAAADTPPELWHALLKWEEDFCSEPGAIDGGTHILAAVRRT